MAGLADEQGELLLRLPAVHALLPELWPDDNAGSDDLVADPSERPAAGDLEVDGHHPPPARSRRHADERLVTSVSAEGPRALLRPQRMESERRRRAGTVDGNRLSCRPAVRHLLGSLNYKVRTA